MSTTMQSLAAAGLAALLLGACGERPAPASSVLGAAAPGVPDAIANPHAAAPAASAAAEPAWGGYIRGTLSARSGGDIAFVIDTAPAFQPEPGAGPQRYTLAGAQTLSVTWIHCTASAEPAVQARPGGTLTIDSSVNPPRYTLAVGTLWDTTIHGQCANGSASVPMRVPGLLQASGTVAADGTIAGSQVLGDLRWEWSFARRS